MGYRHDITQLTTKLRDYSFKPTSFVEIGSRDGHDTKYISDFWSLNPTKCLIIEAHPDCYRNIVEQYPQFNTLNIAASNKTGVTTFNAGIVGQEPNIGVSSLLARTLSSFDHRVIEIDAWKMVDVMQHLKIDSFDFMKIDVEGFGLQVLEGFEKAILNTKYIQIELEVEQVWSNQSYFNDVVHYLDSFGFRIIDDITLDDYQKDVLFQNINI